MSHVENNTIDIVRGLKISKVKIEVNPRDRCLIVKSITLFITMDIKFQHGKPNYYQKQQQNQQQ